MGRVGIWPTGSLPEVFLEGAERSESTFSQPFGSVRDETASDRPAQPLGARAIRPWRPRRIDRCKATGYGERVTIRSFVHKGLKRLYLEDSTKGLPSDALVKLRAMLTFLQDTQDPEKLHAFPSWKAHQLTGGPQGSLESHCYAQLATGVPDRGR